MNITEYQALVGSTAAEFAETGLDINLFFPWAIRKQNSIYELPINLAPTLAEADLGESPIKRMQGFMKTLEKEMKEGQEILFMLEQLKIAVAIEAFHDKAFDDAATEYGIDAKKIVELNTTFFNAWTLGGEEEVNREILVMISDWLGDMQVYNRSEALKYGIPLESVLMVIMGSNFTKLDEDGAPIKDANGKFLKGPNFIPPERHIYATLFGADSLLAEADFVATEAAHIENIAVPILLDPMAEVHQAVIGLSDEEEYYEDEGDVF